MKIFKKLLFYLFIILSINSNSIGQYLSVQIGGDYSYFQMQDLKDIQNQMTSLINSTLYIPFQKLESYPPFVSYSIQVAYLNSYSYSFGLVYNIASTGARSYYGDYSGEYILDYLVSSTSFGIFAEKNFHISKYRNFIFGCSFAYTNSKLKIEEYLRLGSTNNIEKFDTISGSICTKPYFSIQYLFGNFINRFNLGYQISARGVLHHPDDSEAYLLDSYNNKIKVNWSGLRVGASIGYNFILL